VESYLEKMEKEFLESKRLLHFFDAHCWIGRSNNLLPISLSTPDEILEQMDYCGIEKALVSHTFSRYYHPLVGNECLLREISGIDRLQGCFVLIPPSTGEMDSLDQYIDAHVHLGYCANFYMPDASLQRMIEVMDKFKVKRSCCSHLAGLLAHHCSILLLTIQVFGKKISHVLVSQSLSGTPDSIPDTLCPPYVPSGVGRKVSFNGDCLPNIYHTIFHIGN